jgi:hypothetical protein
MMENKVTCRVRLDTDQVAGPSIDDKGKQCVKCILQVCTTYHYDNKITYEL